jgi:selenide,water dikinase
LKDRIDQKFMAMYTAYDPPMMKMPNPQDTETAMRCLGCGGKIGSQILSSVLEELDIPNHPAVVIGLANPDDAAVVKTLNDQVTVTTDFFASPFDDPYLVGRIALLNSASDCFVMGAQPTGVLAIVQLPLVHSKTQLQIMRELMAGSVEEINRMGGSIVGGHSIEGPRLTIGFTVLGDQIVDTRTKGMLQEGDQLILTKPLGSGVLLAALMQARLPGLSYQALVKTMLASNQIALDLIVRHGVSGVTDVTGFGLIGHLQEMLSASGFSARLQMDDVPVMPGCQALVQSGIESTLVDDNRLIAEKANLEGARWQRKDSAVMFDPQTSGGILCGVKQSEVSGVLKFLRDAGFEESAVIGQVVKKSRELPTIELE